MRQAWSSLR